jgi:hypothetical protein
VRKKGFLFTAPPPVGAIYFNRGVSRGRRRMKFHGTALGRAVLLLFAACAVTRLSADDGRSVVESGHVTASYELSGPFAAPPFEIETYVADTHLFYQRIKLSSFLAFDREGGMYVDVNPSLSFEIKAVMGKIEQWAETRKNGDLLRCISLFVYVRY